MIPQEITSKLLRHRKTRYIPIGFQSDLIRALQEIMEQDGYVVIKRNSENLQKS